MQKTINGFIFSDEPLELELLCKASEITEEQAAEILLKTEYFFHLENVIDDFKAYLRLNDMYLSNPMEKPNPEFYMKAHVVRGIDKYNEDLSEWQSYQSKTYKEILIFKIKQQND